MTPTDQNYLARAALSGDARHMNRCSIILDGVAELLIDPSIDGLRRDALLETLRLTAEVLDERSNWLFEEGLCTAQ
ncbi:hypothetical protein ACTXPD_04565 [Vreelandella alkaliphila]|uniref:hypothetical protein n=1 Tax=Vreelandella alkaliphila TaxID=272774 RepID=UPI003FD8ED5D